jgi:putative addiction module component (TIGR02574 family)
MICMKPAAQKLVEQALALPDEERLEIATQLLASVEDGADAEWEANWLAELERRRQEARRDPTSRAEWSAARARVLARVGPAE